MIPHTDSTHSSLGGIALAYTPMWGTPQRRMVGVRLALTPLPEAHVDALHLLQVLRSFWPHRNASLILRADSPALLHDFLTRAPDYAPCLEVNEHDGLDPTLLHAIEGALARGVRLAWRSEAPPPFGVGAGGFLHHIIPPNAGQALAYLASAAHRSEAPSTPWVIHEQPASERLVQACLDRTDSAATLGWPEDEVLLSNRREAAQPSARSLLLVQRAIDQDASLEALEAAVLDDPVLTYRLLIHANSAASGLRGQIDTVRRALMMMGQTALTQWCTQQLPGASQNPNLQPLRTALVLNANLAENLLDAGGEADMRSEIRLCAMLATLDAFLSEPWPPILARMPLPIRQVEAIGSGTGMYAPYLRLASAMRALDAAHLPALCQELNVSLESANRSLLRALGTAPVTPLV